MMIGLLLMAITTAFILILLANAWDKPLIGALASLSAVGLVAWLLISLIPPRETKNEPVAQAQANPCSFIDKGSCVFVLNFARGDFGMEGCLALFKHDHPELRVTSFGPSSNQSFVLSCEKK